MPDNNLTNPTPQFGTAEYSIAPGNERCKSCNQTLSGRYYRVNGAMACESCAEKLRLQLPQDSRQTFMRGLVFGIGGAILGLILYSAFGIITGLVIGYVSLAVGYIVGKATKLGSKGLGGRRYQITAVVLTYAAVSMAAIPMGIAQIMKEKKEQARTHVQQTSPDQSQPNQNSSDGGAGSQPEGKSQIGLGAALGWLALVGLASPFLELQDPFHGVIGLVILFVGLRIAWQLTAGTPMEILGPFQSSAAAPARSDAG